MLFLCKCVCHSDGLRDLYYQSTCIALNMSINHTLIAVHQALMEIVEITSDQDKIAHWPKVRSSIQGQFQKESDND